MSNPLPRGLLARIFASFLMLASVLTIVSNTLAQGSVPESLASAPAPWIGLLVGVLAFFAPWDRWPQIALLSLVVVAMVIKGIGQSQATMASPYVYALHFIILFMWIGIALPRWSALACTPLLAAGYLIPLLLTDAPRADLLSAIAAVPACVFVGETAAWLSTRLRDAEQRSQGRAVKMAGLVDSSVALASCQEREELARVTALGAVEIYRADCSLVLVGGEPGEIEAVGDANWKEEDLTRLLSRAHAPMIRAALSEPERAEAPELAAGLARACHLAALDVLPLRGSGEVVGLVLIGYRSERPDHDPFTSYVARTLATQAGLAFERVESAASLRDASLRDALTAVGNRRAASLALAELQPGDGVALIDLDHFKRVNDSYGHQAGDRVLRTLGEFLRSSVRTPDQVFRFGGEEFLLILSEAGGAADAALKRIRGRWAAQERVTSFSAGVALHLANETPEQTLARTDAALYQAKREGRDRVVADLTGLESLPAKQSTEPAESA